MTDANCMYFHNLTNIQLNFNICRKKKMVSVRINQNHLDADEACSICIEKFKSRENVCKLSCQHLFHSRQKVVQCVEQSLTEKRLRKTAEAYSLSSFLTGPFCTCLLYWLPALETCGGCNLALLTSQCCTFLL